MERVREILRINQDTVSLEQPVGDEDDFNLSDLIEDRGAVVPDDAATRSLLDAAVREALGHLSEREQDVVRLRFGLDDGKIRTLEEVGKEFGVTRERVRQIESKTLAKLRRPDAAHLLAGLSRRVLNRPTTGCALDGGGASRCYRSEAVFSTLSGVAQWQSKRLLTARLRVRVSPPELSSSFSLVSGRLVGTSPSSPALSRISCGRWVSSVDVGMF